MSLTRKKKDKLDISGVGELAHNPFAALGQQFGIEGKGEARPAAAKVGKTTSVEQPMLLVRMEKRKKGKVVTCIYHLVANHKDLLKKLKQRLGTGGSLDGETLELQGDFRETLPEVLREQGFKVRLGN